jgi:lipopolysaccharide export system protein LptA
MKFLAALLACAFLPCLALAEKADRDKPVSLDADKVTVDDAKKVQIFEGNVLMTQGTLQIRTERLVVTQDANGFLKGVATGGPGGLAHFRQKREGKDEYVDGSAERIEHDDRSLKTEFFVRAAVTSGQDELHGNYILYDGKTENYLATSAPKGTPATASDGRVHAVIQPKNKEETEAPKAAPGRAPEAAPAKTAPEAPNPR